MDRHEVLGCLDGCESSVSFSFLLSPSAKACHGHMQACLFVSVVITSVSLAILAFLQHAHIHHSYFRGCPPVLLFFLSGLLLCALCLYLSAEWVSE